MEVSRGVPRVSMRPSVTMRRRSVGARCRSVGAGVVFLGYALVASAALLFVRSRVTETKGRSLEEIEADLQGKAAPA